MEKRELKAFVPKFEKVPWLNEASLLNKPLVLSIPGRYHCSATDLTSYKKGMNLSNLLQVPDVLKARKNTLKNLPPRNKHLCSTCRDYQSVNMKTVQPRNFTNLDHQKPSSKNSVTDREMNRQHPDAQLKHASKHISTESVHVKVPITGPRTSVFYKLLSGTYKAPQETQHLPSPRKK